MSKRKNRLTWKQRTESSSDMAKTMSTLQLWQQQMAALQRASQAGDNRGELNEFGQYVDRHSKTGQISKSEYPHLP